MKILTLLFFILTPSVYSQVLNQKTIIPYLDNLIKSETEIYNYEYKKGKYKLFPLYDRDFLIQKKYDPAADFLIKNFNLVWGNKNLSKKYIQILRMPNFHFGLYLFSKAVDSKQINLIKLYELNIGKESWPREKYKFLERASRFFTNPKTKNLGLDFRDYFLIYNYTMAPRTHFLKKFRKSRSLRGQHIHYNDLNKTKLRKESLRWKVKVDTIKALKKLRPYKGSVYSGLKTNPNLDKKIKKNDILCFGGFLSTSKDKGMAHEYRVKTGSRFLFHLESKMGRDLRGITKFGEEAEVLFYPYKKFKLINIYEESWVDNRNIDNEFGDFGDFGDEVAEPTAETVKFIHVKEIKDYKGPCKSLTRGNKIRPREYWGN